VTDAPVDILLVEDDPNDAEMAVRAIRRHNVTNHIYRVGDGAEALDFIFCRGVYASRRKDDGPMLVLLDLRLPKIDGLDVLRRLQEDPTARQIPVIVITASGDECDLVESFRLGVKGYIVQAGGLSAAR
jgi:two-component system, response regulator